MGCLILDLVLVLVLVYCFQSHCSSLNWCVSNDYYCNAMLDYYLVQYHYPVQQWCCNYLWFSWSKCHPSLYHVQLHHFEKCSDHNCFHRPTRYKKNKKYLLNVDNILLILCQLFAKFYSRTILVKNTICWMENDNWRVNPTQCSVEDLLQSW